MMKMKILLQLLALIGLFTLGPGQLWARSNGEDLDAMYQAIKQRKVSVLTDQDIHIRSSAEDDYLHAEVYAIVPYPLETLRYALIKPSSWCDFVTLHPNIKACTYNDGPQPTLDFYAGRKHYEPPEIADQLRYQFKVLQDTDHVFSVALRAAAGPMGTGDYLIRVGCYRFDSDVLLHLTVSYKTSYRSQVATSLYLSTLGADKVGFSRKANEQGEMVYVDGVNGIIERNVMRYYLALTVYMERFNQPTRDTHLKCAAAWYDATEAYKQQLHELNRLDYLQTKQKEFENQGVLQRQLN
jgi:hypothetical protein